MMNSSLSSSTCEDHLLEVLIDGEQCSPSFQEHVSSCSGCQQQLLRFQQQVDETRDYLAPSTLQMQRIRAKVWDEIERKANRGFSWQPAWTSALVMGCFILLTFMIPYRFPLVAQVVLDGPSLYASADSLEVMADQLLPGTAASEPVWVSTLSGGILESESMEQIDEMIELIIPETGEQT
ncbi:MAG: hypothetical protein KAW01_02500 [Deltaproteobacteria bacterium]|nr:hypothetical protein [Deltaproteobacteria bacterium]